MARTSSPCPSSSGGKRQEVSILTSNIRSFTTISKGMDPEEVVAFLNEYFGRMVPCVLSNNGWVDKYLGDTLIVCFGAPIPCSDHAKRAIRTALMMRQALVEFNEDLQGRGYTRIRVGIGIDTGLAMVGNIGTEQRLEYTIIGDVVSRALRTEALTKEFGADILITEGTYRWCGEMVVVDEPHFITLRGQSRETAIYSVKGLNFGVQ